MFRVSHVSKYYSHRAGLFSGAERTVRAVEDATFTVDEGEVVGIVGESGSGKSTLARLITRLIEPTSGSMWLDNVEVTRLSQREFRPLRPQVQMIFQDSLGSLNPRMTVGRTIAYPLQVSGLYKGDALRRRIDDLLQLVGLSADQRDRLPHQLSGGQRQRVSIARAISTNPRLLVADEPVSALDLSTQAGILNLLRELQTDLKMACIFITHDLAVAEYLCDRILVMYAGRVVEAANARELFSRPRHPYTRALLSSAVLDRPAAGAEEMVVEGDPPDPANLPMGCKFHPRCPYVEAVCRQEEPLLLDVSSQHQVACYLVEGYDSSVGQTTEAT